MPGPRSLTRLAEACNVSANLFHRWSADDGWGARVFEFDRWCDAQRVATMLDVMNEDARERGARHVGLLRDMQDAAAHVVHAWLRRIRDNPEAVLHEFSPNDVSRMVKVAITLERLVHGESTANVDNRHAFDLSRLSIDEIETMRALEAKASG